VSGVVVDETGAPVTDAMVSVMLDPMRPGFQSSFTPPIRTGPNGEFTFLNMFSGNYRITVGLPVAGGPGRQAGTPLPGGGPPPPGVGGGVTGGVTGSVIGAVGGGSWSSTQTVNGVTTQYRSDGNAPIRLTVGSANLTDLRVVVRRGPAPPPGR
jgi:hypothetical protein